MAANLAVTVTSATFFFLFAFAYALDLPEISPVSTTSYDHNLVTLPDSDPKTTTTIILPSEKPETEPATFVDLEPEDTEIPKLSETESKQEKTEPALTDSVPLTVITFRPINRHIARRSVNPFRRGRGCHGRHHHHFNQFKIKNAQDQGQRSYGDDMIISGGEYLGSDRRVPARWAKFNHGGHGFSFTNEEDKRNEMNDRPRHHHHHHHHHRHEEEEGEVKDHKHEYYKGGFMKRIRKFLNNF
ncbi:uncharacterized protein LOC8287759 [Ricinus communis]|uniref:uncharacterized protein LOC8287759 n=1 Tax=Ricinus communis TaxID=3988 RepID=UPI00201A8DD1|nr:uncharacterized protein LOC8287759 [Ricinus communis]